MDAKFDIFAGGLRQIPEWDYVGSNGIEVDNADRVITINAVGENGISVESGVFSLRLGIGIVYDEEYDVINLDYAPTDNSIDEADETSVMTPAATKVMINKLGGGTGGVEYTAGEGIDISEDNVISVNNEWSGSIVDEMTGAYLENTVYDKKETIVGEVFSGTIKERDYITCTSPLVSINIDYLMDGGFGEAVIRFTMAATSTADPFATLPAIQWVGGVPEIELGKSYIISIKDGLGVCCEVTE